MAENGKGDDITLKTKWTGSIYDSSYFFRTSLAKYRQPGNIKIPFWLTPAKHYVGPAWYQKDITVPASFQGKRITIFLERVHIKSRLWINGKEAGSGNTLVTAHRFDVTKFLSPGKHTITLLINNSITDHNVGPDSHSVTDHTQGNWNGVTGKMLVEAGPAVYLDQIRVYPDIHNNKARVHLSVVNTSAMPYRGTIRLSAKSFNTKESRQVKAVSANFMVEKNSTDSFEVDLPMGNDMLLWDEFNPALYRLTASLVSGSGAKDEKQLQFGMREIKIAGTRLAVNGRPVFLRGTVNNCEFPLTGYASMDVASWERIYKVARAHGLNHMRFHSWCPPEAAFIAADLTGFYLQPEAPTWPNHGTSLGDGRFIDQYIYDETNRMEKDYGNYASFCMLAAGNEPAGRNQAAYLANFIRYWQKKDNRKVYTGASVAMSWPLVPENEYMIKSGARGLSWVNARPENASDYRKALASFNVPYVTHEMGQWCVFPNFREIKKYTGVYRARNFELFQEDLKDHGMADQAEDFLMASGKLQLLCYKNEIEKTLRTPGLAGFQLLGLQDFPGQGTALVGTLDAFWEEKGYSTAKEFSRFCNAVVPLSRIPKFVYNNAETFHADIELFNLGRSVLKNTGLRWVIKGEDGKQVTGGIFPARDYPIGDSLPAGSIDVPLTGISKASKLTLTVEIPGTAVSNDWNIWVYPSSLPELKNSDEIYYCTELDAKAAEILNSGGKVLLNAAGKVVKGKEVVMHFTPVFWNTSWFKMRPPHVTGILVQEKHPAFSLFPTSYHSDLQWWEIVSKAQVMNLEDFPAGFRPLVQPIDTWFMNRRLGLVMEAMVGKGKLVVSSANISDDSSRPAARQLWHSLRTYMLSPEFKPKDTVALSVVKDLFQTPSREVWDSFTKDSPDELKPNLHIKDAK
jgi:hypothetical protein